MRVTVTGATGLIGSRLVAALRDARRRGDGAVARRARGARRRGVAGTRSPSPAPAAALAGRDAVVHLAGENVAQRWSDDAKRRIRDWRELGTRNLVAGLRAADAAAARVLVCASAVGYYGPHGDEPLDEDDAGRRRLPRRASASPGSARPQAAEALGMRVVRMRTGIVLDKDGGALAKMLPPFKLGVGGPVAGGRQYMPWIHLDDVVGI